MATPVVGAVNTGKMRYTRAALNSMKTGGLNPASDVDYCEEDLKSQFNNRCWSKREKILYLPRITLQLQHRIGQYPLTSKLASWVASAFTKYNPSQDVLSLVQPFSAAMHDVFEKERAASTGFHDLNLVELIYQITLEAGAEILIRADEDDNPACVQVQYHTSRAGRDDHLLPWGTLLTGLDCDPPIIVQFPFYLMMCQAFGFEPEPSRENYIYSILSGADWAKGKNAYSDGFRDFNERARIAVPTLDDNLSRDDRSFWRIAAAYLGAMNETENARKFTAPQQSYISTNMDPYLLMAVRGIDTIGSAFMCSDGAAYFDKSGIDSLIGSAVPNDVMDLHTDILTGETRNLIRLLYPNGQNIDQTVATMSTVLSGMLCELFRGHKRARFEQREDGRIAAASPPYSFSRARRRRIFEIMETYITKYPRFWDWTWKIYARAKRQVTEAGLDEPLVSALIRGVDQTSLPESPPNRFFDLYFDMIDDAEGKQLHRSAPLGVHREELAEIVRDIHSLWHKEPLRSGKEPGWGREFDERSDALLARAGEILGKENCITEEVFRFAVAYGRLSMGLPYVVYHTIDTIILVYGIIIPRYQDSLHY